MITMPHNRAVADREIALRRLGGDEALLRTLVGFFLEDAPTLVDQLHEAIEAGDWGSVALKAHSLKGLSSTFEAIPFMQVAATMEAQASTADQNQLAETGQQLQMEFDRLIADLKSFAN